MARLPLRGSVIISNVNRQHAYPIVEAAAEAGYLKKFVTSIYYKPTALLGRAMHSLAARGGERPLQRLVGRRSPLIPDDKVVDLPLAELLEQGLARLATRYGVDARPATYLKNEAFDWLVARRHLEPCTIFHGFEQCSLFSLRKARALGAITVLDQPIVRWPTLERVQRQEHARCGVPLPREDLFWFKEHVARKHKEIALADYVMGGLDHVKRTVVDEGFPADRVFVVPYGVDTAAYGPVARPPRAGFEILHVGPLNFWKGLPYMLDVMEGLELPGARLTIVGRSDRDWRPYMDRRIAALGERVRYVGTVPETQMAQFYADADVFVFPSLVGGLGISTLQAMATALPVITSDGDVIVQDGVNALTVPYADTEGWRRALRRLAADRDYRLALGAAGAERLKSFTWDAFRRGVVRSYDEIAEREAARRASAPGGQLPR